MRFRAGVLLSGVIGGMIPERVSVAAGATAGLEADGMNTETKPTDRPEQDRRLPGVLKFLFVAVFFVVVLLLAMSMVHHRFFQGQRVHANGSVGQ